MKVLIVDDTSIMRLVLADVLIKLCNVEKADIIEASSGPEAIRKVKKENPVLVFLDIFMPGMSGKDAVSELLKADPELTIVMCTSSGSEGDVRECINAGAVDYIKKPLSPDRVRVAYENALGLNLTRKISL